MLNAAIFQLRRKLKAGLKWKGSKDVLAWVGNEVIIGFRELRPDLQDFIHNSRGFAIIEVRDVGTAEAFLEAVARAFAQDSEISDADRYLDEATGLQITIIDGFFFAGISDKWMVISNDRDVFRQVGGMLLSPDKGPSPDRTNLDMKIVIGKHDTLGRMQERLITEYGRWNATRFRYRFGNNSAALLAGGRQISEEFDSSNGRTLFLDGDTGLVTSPAFGAESITKPSSGVPYPPLDQGGMVLNISGRFLKGSVELKGSLEFEPRRKEQRTTLSIPSNLSAITSRLRRTKLAGFLTEVIEDAGPWLSSIAEESLSKLGKSAMRPLFKLYFSGTDHSKIRVLRVLRKMEPDEVRKHLRPLYRKRASESDRVLRELYLTLLHFRHEDAIADINEHILNCTVQTWELEIIGDERVSELTPALVEYIVSIGDDLEGSRELRQWLAAEPVRGSTRLGSCLRALSDIGTSAIPEILQIIPGAADRQKALMTLAIMNMPDLTREQISFQKARHQDGEVIEFLDTILKELD